MPRLGNAGPVLPSYVLSFAWTSLHFIFNDPAIVSIDAKAHEAFFLKVSPFFVYQMHLPFVQRDDYYQIVQSGSVNFSLKATRHWLEPLSQFECSKWLPYCLDLLVQRTRHA